MTDPTPVATTTPEPSVSAPSKPTLDQIARDLAARLGETDERPLEEIRRIIRLRGLDFTSGAVELAVGVQDRGGMPASGGRRRTLGGVFFRIVREQLTPEEKRQIFNGAKRAVEQREQQKVEEDGPNTPAPSDEPHISAGPEDGDHL